MIKHILAGICSVAALWAIFYVYGVDKEVHTMDRVNEIFKKSQIQVELENQNKQIVREKEKEIVREKEDNEVEKQLKALKEKAGNVSGFKVSKLYKTKCSSCHGVNGGGGVGPKIIGQSYEKIITSLKSFKDGSKKNYVMYGLLQKLSDEQLEELSKEIANFATLSQGK